jgi:hypothetical protein
MRRRIHNVPFIRKHQLENLKGQNPFGRPTYIWEDNINLGVKYKWYESLNRIPVTQDRVQCQRMS